jgi:hypothetical protein
MKMCWYSLEWYHCSKLNVTGVIERREVHNGGGY